MNNNDQETNIENEISLIDLWLKLWKNKFLIIILTFVLTFISTLGLYLYNNNNVNEEINFNYTFANVSKDRFPNEEIFDYREINTLDFLNNVKDKNNEFKDVNVEKLIENDKTVIQLIKTMDKDDNVVNTHYRINLSTKLFKKDKYLTRKFARAINQEIIEMANEKTKDHTINYIKNDSGKNLTDDFTYIEVMSVIRRQYNELINKYDSFISSHNNPALEGGVLISEIKEDFKRWYDTEVYIHELENEVIQKGYVWNKEKTEYKLSSIEYIDKKISDNNRLLDEYEDRLREILASSSGVVGTGPILEKIVEIINENHYLNLDKEYYEMVKDNLNNSNVKISEEFDKFVEEVLDTLDEKVIELNALTKEYHENNNRVDLLYTYEFETNKPFNMKLILVITLILSGLISVSTAFIKEAIVKED